MNNTQRITALETRLDSVDSKIDRLLAMAEAQAPARVTPPAASPQVSEPEVDFPTWLKDTAEARKARKTSNREMAAWLRSKELPANGPVWDAAKKGNRSVRSLRAIAKKAAA